MARLVRFPLHREPLQLEDKLGRAFLVRRCLFGEPDRVRILEMYRSFAPKECCQGLPPRTERLREDWLARLFEDRLNLVALVGPSVVGHAAILDMGPTLRCEFVVFVHQDHQNRGIGTALTCATQQLAAELGYRRVWLTVEAKNDRAIRVYRKSGFCFVGAMESELEMEAPLGLPKREN